MMAILYRPMVKEALVLVTSGVVATLICSRVYAAPLADAQQTAPPVAIASAPAPAQHQLAPLSKEESRQMLLSMLHGQVPLAMPNAAAGQ
jgi:hypothetical protein